MVTGHKDWRMLRRYTDLKPEDLHKMQKAAWLPFAKFELLALASGSISLPANSESRRSVG